MSGPTVEQLLTRAVERAPGGRNNAGAWLAGQLRDNRYPQAEAEGVLLRFAQLVTGMKTDAYLDREALASVRSAYAKPAREPWGAGLVQTPRGRGPGCGAFTLRRAATVPQPAQAPATCKTGALRLILSQVDAGINVLETPAGPYLRDRGIPDDWIRRCARWVPRWVGLRQTGAGADGARETEQYTIERGYALFGIRSADGRLVGVQGRCVDPGATRCLQLAAGDKSLGLFETRRIRPGDREVILTEAPIDALSAAAALDDRVPVCALCGSGCIPDGHVNLWRQEGLRVFVGTDADAPGDRCAARAIERLTGAGILAVRLRPRPVPGDTPGRVKGDFNLQLQTDGLNELRAYLTAQMGCAQSTVDDPAAEVAYREALLAVEIGAYLQELAECPAYRLDEQEGFQCYLGALLGDGITPADWALIIEIAAGRRQTIHADRLAALRARAGSRTIRLSADEWESEQ